MNIEEQFNLIAKEYYDVVISALSIHHLDDVQKENLFTKIYDMLPEGGC